MKPESSGWTLARVWGAIKKLWFVILAAAVLGGVIALGLALIATPTYQSEATLFFSINQGGSATDLNQGGAYTQSQMQSFAQLATSSKVLQPVIDELHLESTPKDLARSIEVVNPNNTVILEVQVSSPSADSAAEVANAVAESLADVVQEVAPKSAEDGSPSISATLVDKAVAPEFQISPDKQKDTLLGVVIGVLLGVFVALMWTLFDTRIPNENVLGNLVEAPVLGSTSRIRGSARSVGSIVAQEPLGTTSEEFRRIRSALSYAGVTESVQRLLITSSNPGDGKSTFAANLALTLAGFGSRVLLLDADLRRPHVAEIFGLEGAVGLTTVILGDVDFVDAAVQRGNTTLDVLAAGSIPPNPAELLTSKAMQAVLDHASSIYDFVILDSPPVLSVADANQLSPYVDGVILVVDAQRTRRSQLTHAVSTLAASGGRIIGVVLNKATRPRASRYHAYAQPDPIEPSSPPAGPRTSGADE